MQQDKNEYIKRAIKRAYKQYTGERTDGESTLADVAKFFNIPINESRLDDYEIKKINYDDELSLELVDKKNNTEYKAKYTYSYRQNKLGYINVIATNPYKQSEIVYYIGDTDPIVTVITFTDGEYKLTFEKERPNDAKIYYANTNTKFTIRYSLDNNDGKEETGLLSKTFQKHDNGELVYDFERIRSNQYVAQKENLDFQNKHYFIENDSVMHGIDFFQSDLDSGVKGAIFESTKISHIEDRFPSSMDLITLSSKFKDNDTMSAIILEGYAGRGTLSELEVYKTNQGIEGQYKVKVFSTEEPGKITESKKDFQLPNLDEGMITSREISYLLEFLRSRFGDDFIELISGDLSEFAKKIDIRKGILEEELDPLSPKLLFDKPLEEVEKMVEGDIAGYFKLAREQYTAISHQTQEKGQVKFLKPNDSLQSSEN